MKLLKTSKQLISYFINHNHIHDISFTNKTKHILSHLHDKMLDAYKYVKQQHFKENIKHITSTSHIIKPKYFNFKSFPETIRTHIDKSMMTEIYYSCSLYDRVIKVYFLVEDDNIDKKLSLYNKYMESIIMWLYIVNIFASKKCVKTITIYVYFTSLLKKLPESNEIILDENNVNTAFTSTCPTDSEIVVFRKEEWFKVFIHETFHNFGLDFSMMNNRNINNCILDIFDVNSNVNSYEAYTECWAEIFNAMFCSFFELRNKTDTQTMLSNIELFMNIERKYSFFQMVKTLGFMGLTYKDLYSVSKESTSKRISLYKEKSNVLAYYILKTILLNNVQGFLVWCDMNNESILDFKKTMKNQISFCEWIERNYKTKSMLENTHKTEHFLSELKRKKVNSSYLLQNMRMTICELG